MQKVTLVLFGLLLLIMPARQVIAQAEVSKSQRLDGRIGPDGSVYYDLPDLRQGETLSVLMQATSDNLDPFIGLHPAGSDIVALQVKFDRDMTAAAQSPNPVEALNAAHDQHFLAWDDDGGSGYAAALTYPVPEHGDYLLLLSSSAATIWEATFGDYDLFVGIDDPAVLSGDVKDNAQIAIRNDPRPGQYRYAERDRSALRIQTW